MTQLISLTDTGIIAISGEKALEFLQGQLTCDMRAVTKSHTCFAAYCNRQGRVQTSCRVYRIDDQHYLLSLPANQINTTVELLSKYGRFSSITVEEVSSDWQYYGLLNKNEQPAITLPSIPKQVNECCVIDGIFITKLLSHSAITRYEILAKPGTIQCLFDDEISMNQNSIHTWRYHDICSGIAIIDKPAALQFLPHHINYDLINAINVKKGCYLGQEIITRMHHLGKIKQHGYYLVLPCEHDELTIGSYDAIVNIENPDKTVGHIINAVYYDSQYHIFASLQDTACDKTLVLTQNIEHAHQSLILQRLAYQ